MDLQTQNRWRYFLRFCEVFSEKILYLCFGGVNKNTAKNLGELEKAMETLACSYHSCKGALMNMTSESLARKDVFLFLQTSSLMV